MIEALGRSPLFAAFSPGDLAGAAKRLERRTFRAGEVAIESNAPGDSLHVILDGLFKVTRTDAQSGATQLLATFGKGDVFGETALLVETPRVARVTAVVDGETATLSKAAFETLLDEFPRPAARLLREVSRVTVERLRKSLGEMIAATGFDPDAPESRYHVMTLIRERRTVRFHLPGGTNLSGKILRQVRGMGPEELVLEIRKDEEVVVPYSSILFYEVEKPK